MRMTLADCLKANANNIPNKEALVYRDKRFTYQEFDQAVDQSARQLLDAGMKKNDRCAVYMEKSIEEAVSLLAVNRAGGIFIDVNHLHKKDQVHHILKDSGARYLFTTRQRLSQLRNLEDLCPELETIIVHGKGDVSSLKRIAVISEEDAESCSNDLLQALSFTENDIGAIVYTSGFTGKPKGVVMSHRNLVAGAESVSTYLNKTAEDRLLSVMPFSFDYGLNKSRSCFCFSPFHKFRKIDFLHEQSRTINPTSWFFN